MKDKRLVYTSNRVLTTDTAGSTLEHTLRMQQASHTTIWMMQK